MSFSNNLKGLRDLTGLTQAELAEKLGVSQGVVSFWEIGRNLPEASKLPELARILGCTVDDLFQEHQSASAEKPADNRKGVGL